MLQFKREPLTSEEADRLSNACRNQVERAVVWTLLDTGLRVSELCSLDRNRLDWQQHRVNVYGKGGPHGLRSKRRVVPLSPRVAPIIEGLLALHGSLGAPSLRLSVRSVQRMVKAAANRAGIQRPCTPHVLRHTFAVECNRKGFSLPAIQRLLGHENLQTTQVYLNMSPEAVMLEYAQRW